MSASSTSYSTTSFRVVLKNERLLSLVDDMPNVSCVMKVTPHEGFDMAMLKAEINRRIPLANTVNYKCVVTINSVDADILEVADLSEGDIVYLMQNSEALESDANTDGDVAEDVNVDTADANIDVDADMDKFCLIRSIVNRVLSIDDQIIPGNVAQGPNRTSFTPTRTVESAVHAASATVNEPMTIGGEQAQESMEDVIKRNKHIKVGDTVSVKSHKKNGKEWLSDDNAKVLKIHEGKNDKDGGEKLRRMDVKYVVENCIEKELDEYYIKPQTVEGQSEKRAKRVSSSPKRRCDQHEEDKKQPKKKKLKEEKSKRGGLKSKTMSQLFSSAIKSKSRRVLQIDMNTKKEVYEYSSLNEASQAIKQSPLKLKKAIEFKTGLCGYMWCYANQELDKDDKGGSGSSSSSTLLIRNQVSKPNLVQDKLSNSPSQVESPIDTRVLLDDCNQGEASESLPKKRKPIVLNESDFDSSDCDSDSDDDDNENNNDDETTHKGGGGVSEKKEGGGGEEREDGEGGGGGEREDGEGGGGGEREDGEEGGGGEREDGEGGGGGEKEVGFQIQEFRGINESEILSSGSLSDMEESNMNDDTQEEKKEEEEEVHTTTAIPSSSSSPLAALPQHYNGVVPKTETPYSNTTLPYVDSDSDCELLYDQSHKTQ